MVKGWRQVGRGSEGGTQGVRKGGGVPGGFLQGSKVTGEVECGETSFSSPYVLPSLCHSVKDHASQDYTGSLCHGASNEWASNT